MSTSDDTARETATSPGLVSRARRVMPGGITRSTVFVAPHPPYASRGEGAWIVDETGHRVLDANGNYTSLIHGHARAEIVAAATAAMADGSAFGLPTRSEIALAELLSDRVGHDQWRFCNSGTEAVMMLLRAARASTGRRKIIRFAGSYHGTAPDVVGDESHGDVLVVQQGDTDGVAELLTRHRGDVAGVLIDLMPNRAGLHPALPEHVTALRALTREHGALLLIDEIITFRVHSAGLAARYGVTADLVSLGKVIGGGLPVGAIGGRRELLAPFDPTRAAEPSAVSWGGTFSANPVVMSAGRTALELLDATTITSLNAAGDQLREALSEEGLSVTGSGSLVRIHLRDTAAAWWRLYERGVLLGANGLLALSTAMDDDDLQHLRTVILAAARADPDSFARD